MNHSLIAVLLAGAMLAACSSKGEPGPVGPTGARGDQGLQGSPGQPGEPVLSAQLSVGSVDCPNGGSQFTSVSGTTFACSGADGQQGIQGPSGSQGPKGDRGDTGATGVGAVMVLDGNGNDLGPLVGVGGKTFTPEYSWLSGGKIFTARAGTGAWVNSGWSLLQIYWLNSFCTPNPGEGPWAASTEVLGTQFVIWDGVNAWTPSGAPTIRTPRSRITVGGQPTGAAPCESLGPDPVSLVDLVPMTMPPAPAAPLTLR